MLCWHYYAGFSDGYREELYVISSREKQEVNDLVRDKVDEALTDHISAVYPDMVGALFRCWSELQGIHKFSLGMEFLAGGKSTIVTKTNGKYSMILNICVCQDNHRNSSDRARRVVLLPDVVHVMYSNSGERRGLAERPVRALMAASGALIRQVLFSERLVARLAPACVLDLILAYAAGSLAFECSLFREQQGIDGRQSSRYMGLLRLVDVFPDGLVAITETQYWLRVHDETSDNRHSIWGDSGRPPW